MNLDPEKKAAMIALEILSRVMPRNTLAGYGLNTLNEYGKKKLKKKGKKFPGFDDEEEETPELLEAPKLPQNPLPQQSPIQSFQQQHPMMGQNMGVIPGQQNPNQVLMALLNQNKQGMF